MPITSNLLNRNDDLYFFLSLLQEIECNKHQTAFMLSIDIDEILIRRATILWSLFVPLEMTHLSNKQVLTLNKNERLWTRLVMSFVEQKS
jgi:hypothetical protein